MTTQVIFNIDSGLKAKAMKKAQSEGIPFSSVLNLATKAYVEGSLDITLAPAEKFNATARKTLDRALKDLEEGKVSPRFKDADSLIKYLKNLK